ncbi:hypothetical protein [Streptomyces sp. UG1]|uniref:hypothetical protein n=1 Tax=Streptomyces sp. UG1 TaxID=3417652 RepID=UPI003CF6D1FB
MTPDPVSARAGLTIAQLLQGPAFRFRHSAFPVVSDDDVAPVGLATVHRAQEIAERDGADATLADAMFPMDEVVTRRGGWWGSCPRPTSTAAAVWDRITEAILGQTCPLSVLPRAISAELLPSGAEVNRRPSSHYRRACHRKTPRKAGAVLRDSPSSLSAQSQQGT